MAGKLVAMSKLKQIIRLRAIGKPIKTISKNLGVSKNTVKKYLNLIQANQMDINSLLDKQDYELEAIFDPPSPVTEERYQHLEAMFPHMVREMERVGVDRWVLWGEYRKRHPDGYSYSHYCYLIVNNKKPQKRGFQYPFRLSGLLSYKHK